MLLQFLLSLFNQFLSYRVDPFFKGTEQLWNFIIYSFYILVMFSFSSTINVSLLCSEIDIIYDILFFFIYSQ